MLFPKHRAICVPIGFDKFKYREYSLRMRSLWKIQQAADALPAEQKKELVAFLWSHLRGSAAELPPARDIPISTIQAWVADDEEGYRKFLAGS
jgi:hypothetical protein